MSAMTKEIRGERPILICVKLISWQTLEGLALGPLFNADYENITENLSLAKSGCQAMKFSYTFVKRTVPFQII